MTWLCLVRATHKWWPSKQTEILTSIWRYLSPPMSEGDLIEQIRLDGTTIEETMDPLEMGGLGKLQLTLLLRATHCQGKTEVPGPGGMVFWDDAFFSYVDALDDSLDSYERCLDDLSRKG